MMVKPKKTSGLYQETLFTVITWNQESNCTCRRRIIPCSSGKKDVTRTTYTTLDVMMEKILTISGTRLEKENYHGDRELSDTWTGFTTFTFFE